MNDKEDKSLDVFGLKAYGETAKAIAAGMLEGIGAFLSRICLPAAEEFGFLLKDKVSYWRILNLAKIAEKAQKKLNALSQPEKRHAPPRLVYQILESGSWIEDEEVQELWAGLLASSCSEDGEDESNLIFINLLSQLTSLQVRTLNYACINAEKKINPSGVVAVQQSLFVTMSQLKEITGTDDVHKLDRELDHLKALGLIWHSLFAEPVHTSPEPVVANLKPRALALQMFVRCQGTLQSPADYFGLSNKSN